MHSYFTRWLGTNLTFLRTGLLVWSEFRFPILALLFLIWYIYFLLFYVIGLVFEFLELKRYPDLLVPINYGFKYPPNGGFLRADELAASEYGS